MEGYNVPPTTDYFPASSGLRTRREAPADEPRTRLPSKLPSRLPSTTSSSSSSSTSTRRPSLSSSQVPRPAPNHQPQSWGSANTVTSGRSGTNSGSSSSGKETGFARYVLHRRRASAVAQETDSQRNNSRSDSARTSSSSSNPRSRYSLEQVGGLQFDRTFTESPAELRNGQAHGGEASSTRTAQQTVVVSPSQYPELANRYQHFKRPSVSSETSSVDFPHRLTTEDLPPPTPGFLSTTSSQLSGLSASPSTRFSESPGPGPYSRDTTPTSMASQSPGLAAPMRMPMAPPPRGVRPLTGSPAQTRPPVSAVTRRRAGSNEVDAVSADPDGLAAVRESLTSSSSNSTVRTDGDRKERKAKTRQLLSPPPPSPPPRTSSNHAKTRDDQNPTTAAPSLLRRPGAHARTGSTGSIISSLATGRTLSSTRQGPIASFRATPPPRPSRDGTPDIQSQLFEPPRVIHSNLSSAAVATERRGSEPAVAPSSLPRSTTPSESRKYQPQPSRLPSTNTRDVESKSRTTSSATRVDARNKREPTASQSTRTPSPSVSSSFNKTFGFLRRKTAPDITAAEKDRKEKLARKGPAAGTGHEGYGRLGAVRRRSGGAAVNTRGPGGAVSSSESLISQSEFTDPFLRDRLSPIVIRGGEIVENHNIRTETSQSSSRGYGHSRQASNDSKISSEMSTTSEAPTRNTLWPSAFPRAIPMSSRVRRPSESSAEGDVVPMKGTLAHRRSMQKLRASPEAPLIRMPRPLNTSGITSPSHTSLDSNVLSDDSEAPPKELKGRKGSLPQPKKLTKPAKSPRSLWPFGRSRSQPPVDNKKKKAEPVPAQVKLVKGEKHAAKHQAFYEMLSEQEDSTGAVSIDERVRETLRDADVYDHPSPKTRVVSPQQLRDRQRRPSVPERQEESGVGRAISPPQPFQAPALSRIETPPMMPPPPQAGSLPSPPQSRPQLQAQQPRNRRRLREVGRIPKVISTRSDAVEPPQPPRQPQQQSSPMSFSRPFNRMSIQMPPRITGFLPNNDSKGTTPPPAKPETPDLTQEGSTVTGGSRELSPDITRAKEFISFTGGYSPPRKDSECTTITTSSADSVYLTAPALLPAANEPLVEDEIWDEYNDLLVDDGIRPPPSATSSKGMPFALESYSRSGKSVAVVDDEDMCDCGIESPTLSGPRIVFKKSVDRLRPTRRGAPVASSVYSVDFTDKLKADFGFEEPPSPGTPFSISRFVVAYGDRTDSFEMGKKAVEEEVEVQTEEPQPSSKHSSSEQPSTRRSGGSRKSAKSTASSSSKTSDEETPLAQVNLRVGSMTVSKWLTFGHVLFSPTREQLLPVEGSLKRHSILVIDGLGNDDWSFYAAETYPAATFYNLSPRTPLPRGEEKSASSFPLSPPNHHQIQYTSHLAKFPFGPESFTSVVFRFPAAGPESHYRNIVTEARRVLKPGGYVELSILDVDLNSMGSRGRRQVRQLKERIREKNPETSLGSTADLMLRLLGKKGFTDIKTCRVGVPVASSIARSNSTSSRRSGKPSDHHRSGPSSRKGKGKEERSLAEMMSDDSEIADEGIAKMVSRVGRWWYTRCYESAAGVGTSSSSTRGKNSMWSDASLLKECEEWGTSLKLMVCYARVPDDGRARVASI